MNNLSINSLLTNSISSFSLDNTCIQAKQKALSSIKGYFEKSREEKNEFAYPLGQERGYRHLGNRESVLLRNGDVPESLKDVLPLAEKMHQLSLTALDKIERKLQLTEGSLRNLTHSSFVNGTHGEPNASICRIFKYFPTEQIAAEAHNDIGLITLILKTNCPALETWNKTDSGWENIERSLHDDEAIIMTGKSLSYVTNNKVESCLHRVAKNDTTRYSIVYQLRMAEDAIFDSTKMQSPQITPWETPIKKTGKQVLEDIRSNLTSINGSYQPGENNMQIQPNNPINIENNETFFGRVVRVGGEAIISIFTTIIKIVTWVLNWLKEMVLSCFYYFVPGERLQIFCKVLNGSTVTIESALSETVASFKTKLFVLGHGTGPDSQSLAAGQSRTRLIFAGKQLEDDQRLMVYNVQRENTIHMVLGLGGD